MRGISDMDANQDGLVTFEEFSEPHLDKLKAKFKMLDVDNDEQIDEDEWKQFLKWHGLDDDTHTEPAG